MQPEASHRATLRPTSRGKLVGRSRAMSTCLATLDRVARSSCTVLVCGESGTGKEMVVAALHDASARSAGPLVTVNCGAIPEKLIESELFGHARGAFTGAEAARQGRVAAAEGGTLFLDEIGELSLSLQVRLLRLLQQREYSPVGDDRVVRCDVRIVAATNRDLEREVRDGRFREDLFYRLNVIVLELPALRDRPEDLDPLARHFFTSAALRAGRDDLSGISAKALTALRAHDWPGNVRELENVVERAALLAAGPWIEPHDLPPRIAGTSVDRTIGALPAEGIDFRAAVDGYQSDLIRQALARTQGNKNQAARLLGINRTTLVEIVKRMRVSA